MAIDDFSVVPSMIDFPFLQTALSVLVSGVAWTVIYSAASLCVGCAVAVVIVVMVLGNSRIARMLAGAFVSAFRGVPLLVQLLIAYYCLPAIGFDIPPWAAAILVLSLCEGAYLAENLRGGFLGVPHGQIEAGRMLGLGRGQILRTIELPIAIRLALPALINEATMAVKASSLISVVGVVELTKLSQNLAATSYQPLEAYLAAGLLYLAVNGSLMAVGTLASNRLARVRIA